mmetsp:Transcript_80329/g.159114  ORF Transcript_80329/g.159114 Transcript_80329/m.159114 type:complete len:290 (-) Transcript_80329:381-1250(-)
MAEPQGKWLLPHVLFPDEEDDIACGQTSDPGFYTGPVIQTSTAKTTASTACEPMFWTMTTPRWLDGADQKSKQQASETKQSSPNSEESQNDLQVSEESLKASEIKQSSLTSEGSQNDFQISEDSSEDCWTSERLARQCASGWLDGADQRSKQDTPTNLNEGYWSPETRSFLTSAESQQVFGASEDSYQAVWTCERSTQQFGLTTPEFGSSLRNGSKRKGKKTCKGQRDRYRKLVTRLTDQIRENPRAMDIDKMLEHVPPSVASSDWLKNKLANRLVQAQSQALRLLSDA